MSLHQTETARGTVESVTINPGLNEVKQDFLRGLPVTLTPQWKPRAQCRYRNDSLHTHTHFLLLTSLLQATLRNAAHLPQFKSPGSSKEWGGGGVVFHWEGTPTVTVALKSRWREMKGMWAEKKSWKGSRWNFQLGVIFSKLETNLCLWVARFRKGWSYERLMELLRA